MEVLKRIKDIVFNCNAPIRIVVLQEAKSFEQDNTSAILLEKNGKSSSGKRTRHLNIRCFCITDLPEKQEFEVKHCPTEDVQADFCPSFCKVRPLRKCLSG